MMEEPLLLTGREAAKILRIHKNTLYRWADRGHIPFYRMPQRGDRRFLRADIEQFLGESRQ